ncbi:MAG: response regulator [Nitrospirota bacterium]
MPFGKKVILLIDDSETFVMYMAILLKRMGYNIIPAKNGVEALRLLKILPPDLVMLDIQMPMIDGIKVLAEIKKNEKTSAIPVIMLTSDAKSETMEKCAALGCSGYLTKPVMLEDLHGVIQDVFFRSIGWKRKHIRVQHVSKVTLIKSDERFELFTETLSEGGMYVRNKNPFPVGTQIKALLDMDDEVLDLEGIVIYNRGIYGDVFKIPPGMAIEFTEVSEKKSAALTGYISGLLAEDLITAQEENVLKIKNNRVEISN